MANRPLAECTLLLVDDEPANLELLQEFLRPEGFRSLLATSDAREALPLLEANAPDMVLLDLHMPHLSGFELLREIRQRTPVGEFVPVLVLTADVSRATRARALSEGAHDFLTKPLDALEVRLRVRNLLESRLLHLEQRRARQAAEAATAARELVLSVVAHDLRNPLASIAMDAEMARHLLPEREHPAQYRAVARIERTAQRMQRLIEDLLEVSRLEAGTFTVRREPIAASRVFDEAEAMLQPLAHARGIRLGFRGPTELPTIAADGERLVQLLSNLVGNALKFTPAGGTVEVGWSLDAGVLSVAVADDGPGIALEQIPHLFRAFWQGSGTARRSGLGLGLVIARAIVEAHGGRIWIESTPGAGTAVRLTLPLAPAEESVVSALAAPSDRTAR
jgi:signal transduction histidine kinase